MKKIIAAIATLIVIVLMVNTFMTGPAFQGGEAGNIIEDLKMLDDKKAANSMPPEKDVEADKIKSLRDKAGNTSSFAVSNAYKSRCASCHGVNGSGEQNGKKLMGPKLIGQSAEKIYKDLIDFKAGRKENYIMKGLLINLSEEELKTFADEIGDFANKAAAQQ